MLILYAISVVSFCALVWAAYAITRHIRLASSAAHKPADTTSGIASRTTTTGTKPTKTVFAGNPGASSKQPQVR